MRSAPKMWTEHFRDPGLAEVSDEQIVIYLEDMTPRDDPEDGFPVLHRARRFTRFHRTMVPLDWFAPSERLEPVDPEVVKMYRCTRPDTAPPIVVDGIDRRIIDGFHRFNAALRRGDRAILAYVGITPRHGWRPWHLLDRPCGLHDPSSERYRMGAPAVNRPGPGVHPASVPPTGEQAWRGAGDLQGGSEPRGRQF